jgi:hypothetical protein
MFTDKDIQLIEPPILHVQSDGSNIGGVDPAHYGYQIVPDSAARSLLLYTAGNTQQGKYPAFEWGAHPRPIKTTSGRFSMSYSAIFGGNIAGMNVFETDTILIANCSDGKRRKFNLSLQRHAATGQIDIGDWTNTKLMTGAIKVWTNYDVRIDYSWNAIKNICSVLTYELNGMRYEIPESLQNMAATESNWAVGALPQIQLGSVPAANPWNVKISNLQYLWY